MMKISRVYLKKEYWRKKEGDIYFPDLPFQTPSAASAFVTQRVVADRWSGKIKL